MKPYNFTDIEKKWIKKLEEGYINKPNENKEKYYCLDMFPYPSSNGLHVGHWRGYTLSDVLSRYKLLQGYEVLHPMGWDAFGLPAENFAIKTKTHPSVATEKSIEIFKRQMKEIGAIYNWDKELSTTDPNFYKWTQWIFIKMFEEGLAYEKEMPLNWCENCKAVLANEEATNGVCDRCGSVVTKKMLRQWMLKITKYSERLLLDLDNLKWPEKVKKMQSDWIGKSYGVNVDFKIENIDEKIKIFTTRADTLYGSTFMVLAPEHNLVKEITTNQYKNEMDKYVFDASTKSFVDRMSDKEKTGVFTGTYGINPINNERVPIWVSDYVLMDYGTGAIMCVPGHDQRDFEFATKFNLMIRQVIIEEGKKEEKLTEAFLGEGIIINSEKFNGLKIKDAQEKISKYLEEEKIGASTINYKLRDWVFSRQRYWGEPIPIVHCEKCGAVPVDEKDLPVILPDVNSYEPTNSGESPLANISEWVNTICPKCGGEGKRETNTMPQWAGSSWYYLRYPDSKNNNELASKKSLEKWLPVDMYVGGIEHAVLHLLYSRFYTKFLFDIGVIDFEEPFLTLFNQGMILKDGVKMSKSLGNTVSPDELVKEYGCDSLRMYELFVGPPELDSEWNDRGIEGVFKFLNRTWRLINGNKDKIINDNKELEQLRNKMIYDITSRIEALSMNTVISGYMEYCNTYLELSKKYNGLDTETLKTFCILLSPVAPNISEEMWETLGYNNSIFEESWPVFDEEKMKTDTIKIAVQVNGKLRESIEINRDEEKEKVLEMAKKILGSRLENITIVKEIYVPERIVNIVVK